MEKKFNKRESENRREGANRKTNSAGRDGNGNREYTRDGNRSYNRPAPSSELRAPRHTRDNRDNRNYDRNDSRDYNRRDDNRDGNRETGRDGNRTYNRDYNRDNRSYNRDDNRGYNRSSMPDSDSRPSRYNRNYNREDNRDGNRNDNRSDNRRYYNRNDSRDYNCRDNNNRDYTRDGNRSYNHPAPSSELRAPRKNYDRADNRDGNRNDNRSDNRRDYNRNDSRDYNRRDNNNRDYTRDSNRTYNRPAPSSELRAPRHASRYDHPVDEAAKEEMRQKHYSKKKQLEHRIKHSSEETELRLNRYISMGGVCSRRDADALITEGRVKVNGEVVQTVGVKVKRTDKVQVDGRIVEPERKVYLVLNKPKDYVTTVEDPLERKTVMSLLEGACKERVYPIGRLDRQTSGVLLFTNDGDLAKKLTHPKYEHKKIYHVFLDKPLTQTHLEAISNGIELEDGPIKADEISYVSTDQTEVGIEVHSGRNRIVRRIFEHFDYRIERLDRVYFAGITKKNLPRGRWRFLTPQEVKILKIYKNI